MPNGTRTVTGVFRTPVGLVFPNKTMTWFRAQRKTVAQAGAVIVDEPFRVNTDAVGAISIEALPGDYLVLVSLADQDRYFQVGIPEGSGPFDVADGVATLAPPVTAEEVLLARAARDESAAFAAAAETASNALASSAFGYSFSFTPPSLEPITLDSETWLITDLYVSGLPQFSPEDWEQVGATLILKRDYMVGQEVRYRYRVQNASTVISATIADGTQSTPSLAFAADPDTGIYRDGANVLAFSAGGQKRGHVSPAGFRMDVLMTGLAVVQSTSDVTAGRLLTTNPGPAQAFRRGNILGALAMSGGVPTGAMIERGANANGEFMKLADGTQLCYGSITSSTSGAVTMTYPASFFVTPKVFALPAGSASRQITWTGRGNTSVDLHCFNLAGGREAVAIDVLIVGRWA